MEYKVTVISKKVLDGHVKLNLTSLINVLARYNLSLTGLSVENKLTLEGEENLIIFTENSELDKVIIDNINKLGSNKKVYGDLAVKFVNNGRNLIFLPVDIEWETLLTQILEEERDQSKKYCKFHLFGKNPQSVSKDLENLEGVTYRVIGDNLLTDVYLSYQGAESLIDDKQVKIAGIFRDNLYSENDLGLSQIVFELLRLKNLKLSVKETVTGGKVLSRLNEDNEGFYQVLKKGEISEREGALDAEKTYISAYNYLKDTGSDVVIVIDGEFDKKGMSSVIAVGDKSSILVYKNRFNAKRSECLEMATTCALFHLTRKLRQNDFAF